MSALPDVHDSFANAAKVWFPPDLHVLARQAGRQAWGRFGLA